MPYDLALFDLISPYVLLGDSFGSWHAALSIIYVDEHTIAVDDAGVVIRGIARFSGSVTPWVDPSTMSFGVNGETTEGHPANDAGRRDPWIDVRDAHIDFQLTAPRIASQKVASAVTAIGASASFAQAAAVLTALDTNPADPPPSDYPSTEFVLDLLLTTVLLRPPFLRPAKLLPNGQMVADTTKSDVTFTLPRIKLRLAQGSNVNDPLTVTLLSAGARSLERHRGSGSRRAGHHGPAVCLHRPVQGRGVRLPLCQRSTSRTARRLPTFCRSSALTRRGRASIYPRSACSSRLTVRTILPWTRGPRNLLIGFGSSAGVTGDFDLEIIDQGSGTLRLGARFYDNAGRSFAITRTSDTAATVALPAQTRMVVDINGGLTPYTATAAFDGGAPATGRGAATRKSAAGRCPGAALIASRSWR